MRQEYHMMDQIQFWIGKRDQTTFSSLMNS